VRQYEEKLLISLKDEDAKKLCSKFQSYGVIPAVFVEKFNGLDDQEDHLPTDTRVR